MEYREFINYIRDNIRNELVGYEKASIIVKKIVKNNSIELDGLIIKNEDESVAPTIYLNRFYSDYREGAPIDCILKEIAKLHINNVDSFKLGVKDMSSFTTIEDRVIARVVNYEKNKEMLEDCPYIKLNDLAVTFRWLAHKDEIGIATALICNKELEKWGIEMRTLSNAAIKNTPRIFPSKINDMRSILKNYIDSSYCESDDMRLYVLTNEQGINGATCMVYPDILKKFADSKKKNLYILPSSVHEVILIPTEAELDVKGLRKLVRDANNTVVCLGDILSDSVYYYDRKTNNISIME